MLRNFQGIKNHSAKIPPFVVGYLNYRTIVLTSYTMTSSSSASSTTSTVSSSKLSSSSTKVSPPLSQYNFDPFAVHPFTSYASSNPNGNAPTMNYGRNNPSCTHAYRQPFGDYATPMSSPLATTIPIIPPHQQSQSLSTKPCAYKPPRPTGIFVPYRKETSTPELSDVLKPKSHSPPSMMTASKTRPNNTATFIPASPTIGLEFAKAFRK